MLAGRYPSDEFAELRPRVVWDRTAGIVRARPDARRLAVTSGGTIPDRGLYGVFLADSGARVGELDEEMVYEARQGEVFQLGASSWRIEQITRDRVLVSPAPGVPGRMPFWKGDGVGRPYELGRAVGEAARTRRFTDLDERAARNLHAYLDDQEAATGVIPSDRTIVVERFRDEIGDWRICVLSPFGGRVHAPWALALEARMSSALGIEVEAMWADDGIALRLPDSDTPPPVDLIAIAPGRARRPAARARLAEPALRRPLPRERRPRPAAPAPPPGAAYAALAAAAEGARPAAGRDQVRVVPDPARDLPRGALRRVRGAGAEGPARGDRTRPGAHDRGRVGPAVAVRLGAALRLHRDATCTRATRRRPSGGRRRCSSTARCSPSSCETTTCASCSTPARSTRSRRSCRARAARRPSTRRTTCCAGWATCRRPRRRPAACRPTSPSSSSQRRAVVGADRRRGARRSPPRTRALYRDGARRRAAARAAGRLPRAGARCAAPARAALRPHPRPVRRRRPARALRRRPRRRSCARLAAEGAVDRGRRSGPAAAGGVDRARTCCGGCGGGRSPRSGARSSRSRPTRWRGSCRPGRGSAATPAAGSTGCATWSPSCRAWRCR